MNGLQISLQQYDDKHKPKPNPKFKLKQEEERHANNTKRVTERTKATPEEFEKFKKELQDLGMWLAGDAFKKMTVAQKRAHHEKIKALRARKQGPTTPETQLTTYAQVATATRATSTPTNPPANIVQHNRTYRLATSVRTYQANNQSKVNGSLIDGGCNGGLAGEYVLILEEHSFGKVDIVGVGNNLIKDIPDNKGAYHWHHA
jgi:hypothetical protein